MAKGVNKVFLLGNVGKDPEIRSTAGGMIVASFSLATADRQKDQPGQLGRQDRVAQSRRLPAAPPRSSATTSKRLAALHRRQDPDPLLGRQRLRGEKKYNTEILVNELTLLGGAPGGRSEGGSTGGYSKSNTASYDQRTPASQPDYADTGITDDDIPF